jgi:hypothetical protein
MCHHGSLGLNFHEVKNQAFFMCSSSKISFDFRFACYLDHGITVMNDTGSNMLSPIDTDMQHLGNLQGYTGMEDTRFPTICPTQPSLENGVAFSYCGQHNVRLRFPF